MRKSFYLLTRSALMFVMLMVAGSTLFAQTTITWTGAVDSDATNKANWDPQLDLTEDVWLQIDSAHNYTNSPVFSGSDSVYVGNVLMARTAELTIDFDDPLDMLKVHPKDNAVFFGFVDVVQGILDVRRMDIKDTSGIVNIFENGMIRAQKYFFMNGRGEPSGEQGGFLNMHGTAKVEYTASQANQWGRFSEDTTTSIIQLDTLSTMKMGGDDKADYVRSKIARGQILPPEGYEVMVEYDGISNNIWCRHLNELIIVPSGDQFGITGTPTAKIGAVQNNAWTAATSLEWKFATAQGGPYSSFSTPLTTDSVEITFADAGKFWVVLTDVAETSNEVVFIIGSDKVVPAPDGVQYLRPETDGAMITATVDAAITSQEWKWSTTPGTGHVSFTTPATGLEFSPNFDAAGTYYVICEGSDGSNAYPSKDVKIIVDDVTRDIYWKGSVSNDGMDPANWAPMANIAGNTVMVEHEDTYGDSLVIATTGHLRINKFDLLDSTATLTVDMGVDSLTVGRNSYFYGHVIVNSGRMRYNDVRHRRSTALITVQGTGIFAHTSQLIMGQSNTSIPGGSINVKDNGTLVTENTWPLEARWCTDTTYGVITITDNGKWFLKPGDWTPSAAKYMAKNQVKTSEEEKLVVTYPVIFEGDSSTTEIKSKSLVVFDISPTDDQVVGVGEAVAELSTVNAEDRTKVEWMYGTASGGPYMAFATPETGDKFSGSFDAAGDMFVICEGYAEDTVVSSEVKVSVIGVTVAPADDQAVLEAVPGTALTVTETVAADSREWKTSTTSGSGYTAILPPQSTASYTPLFLNEGTYYVICASTFGTKTINSNEVKVVVSKDHTAIEDNFANSISMYPNPAQNSFHLDAGDYASYNVKISDLTGRTVMTREYVNVNGPQMIELSRNGIYFVEIRTADNVHTAKMIIK